MLSRSQVAQLEKRLLDERRSALRTLRDTWRDIRQGTASDGEAHRTPSHMAEQGSDQQRELFEIQNAWRHSELLSLIDGALMRLRESPEDYDRSVVSGKLIPFERLELVPWTRVRTDELDGPRGAGAHANGNGHAPANGHANGNGRASRNGARRDARKRRGGRRSQTA